MSLSTKLPWEQANTQWASQLNPVVNNPLNNISIIKNYSLIDGTNVINHGLQKTLQGWFLTDIQGAATIYRSEPFNALTLTLVSNAAVTVSIGVY